MECDRCCDTFNVSALEKPQQVEPCSCSDRSDHTVVAGSTPRGGALIAVTKPSDGHAHLGQNVRLPRYQNGNSQTIGGSPGH